jgi:hypothetical protein
MAVRQQGHASRYRLAGATTRTLGAQLRPPSVECVRYVADLPLRPSNHATYSVPSGAACSAWKLCEPKSSGTSATALRSSVTVTGALQL